MSEVTLITEQLHKQIKEDILNSSTVYILSSFMMKSGVEVILSSLKEAALRGVDIKILTGDYLYITQPRALQRLLEIEGNNLEIRLWQSDGISFHPKSFIFKHKEDGAIIVGSSNLSRSALTSGIEWNVRVKRNKEEEEFDQAIQQYIHLFYNDKTVEINKETIKNYDEQYHEFHKKNINLVRKWSEREEIELTLPITKLENETIHDNVNDYEETILPRPSQEEALKALENTVKEQYDKAMVVMATGLGKTYLAAFFAKHFKKILFVAHREEILRQAKKSFERVLKKDGGLFYGKEKNSNVNMLFASIYTLSIQDHLKTFTKDEFDLIIIDEFHHAAANSYKNIINYFTPKFLLGLTATPERTDGQDVFALCEGNVAYEITFMEAIQRNWLAPFHYYGVKDDIDYSKVQWLGNRYDEHQLLIEQLNEERAQQIFNKWLQLKQTRTIGFCSSIQQAKFLEEYFQHQGINAISLTSQTTNISRSEAINKLEGKEIEIIFTVDLFNEGVDIPSVDTLLFVRPTESLVIFTQQIGRGLRKHATKDYCVIIDLIGNYRHADTKLRVFTDGTVNSLENDLYPKVPNNCKIHLEVDVINLLEEMKRKRSPRKEKLYEDYIAIKKRLGRRPTYREIHLYGNVNSKEYRQIYGGYFAFLYEINELSKDEREVYDTYYKWLLKLEKEHMTKSYKMVVLQFLLEKGPSDWYKKVTPNEVAPYFHHFYMSKSYRKKIDFSNNNTKKLWNYNERKVAELVSKMPMSRWVGKDNLISFENNEFRINFEIQPKDEIILHKMTKQICEYKMQIYFERKGYKSS